MKKLFLGTFLLTVPIAMFTAWSADGSAGETSAIVGDYKLLEPITHGDLTVFPVVSVKTHDTSGFLTLDEGIRSGEVVVTEVGNLHGAMRRRPNQQSTYQNAQVNQLVLVNNSQRPLILLAGEIVTGGKQDRVVAKDRIVPAESDPVDLGVFCVEPHRWVANSSKFDTHASVMAQPSVRKKAMAEKDQQQVWAEVNNAKTTMAANARAAAPPAAGNGQPTGIAGGSGTGAGTAAPNSTTATVEVYASNLRALDSTSSYAEARENGVVQKQVEEITEPMQKSYESLIKQLRNQNAIGVVVAVKGHIVWADLFASSALLSKYWPKLLQSYAAEALTTPGERREASLQEAQKFLANWQARHETVDSEPGLYRQRELMGDGFRAFELTSLLPKAGFDVHLSKMAE
jgi:ARG and Rhodanese-Phosphatase-superfamily-associated Protein domain